MIYDLHTIISKHIAQNEGKISFAEFMQQALYHPQYGYYTKQITDIGKQGDFTTAPEISSLFTQCIAKQAVELFEKTGVNNVLEIGAGTGRLANDFLALHPGTTYFIYETSPTLRALQQQRIQHPVQWLDELPDQFSGLIIANEVLDALPFCRIEISDQQIKECYVTTINNELSWQNDTPSSACAEIAEKIKAEVNFFDGYQTEIHTTTASFVTRVLRCLKQGMVLFFDYGYGRHEYYHPQRANGTLTCFFKHQKHQNPFMNLGKQDITAHVDFTQVAEAGIANEAELIGFTTQAGFLFGCGVTDNLPDKLSWEDAINQQLKVLTMPSEMGEVIKVMGLGKRLNFKPMGFTLLDRRRDL